jgi:hypothetical protein
MKHRISACEGLSRRLKCPSLRLVGRVQVGDRKGESEMGTAGASSAFLLWSVEMTCTKSSVVMCSRILEAYGDSALFACLRALTFLRARLFAIAYPTDRKSLRPQHVRVLREIDSELVADVLPLARIQLRRLQLFAGAWQIRSFIFLLPQRSNGCS